MDSVVGVLIDRRRAARTRLAHEHGIVLVRIRPGHDASLIDVSADGALIETAHRLLPGRHIELHLETVDERAAVRGRVVRCAVAAVLASRVQYQGAIGFERQLSWLVTSKRDEYSVLSPPDAVSVRP
jgi:hypothetical protein